MVLRLMCLKSTSYHDQTNSFCLCLCFSGEFSSLFFAHGIASSRQLTEGQQVYWCLLKIPTLKSWTKNICVYFRSSAFSSAVLYIIDMYFDLEGTCQIMVLLWSSRVAFDKSCMNYFGARFSCQTEISEIDRFETNLFLTIVPVLL